MKIIIPFTIKPCSSRNALVLHYAAICLLDRSQVQRCYHVRNNKSLNIFPSPKALANVSIISPDSDSFVPTTKIKHRFLHQDSFLTSLLNCNLLFHAFAFFGLLAVVSFTAYSLACYYANHSNIVRIATAIIFPAWYIQYSMSPCNSCTLVR